MYLVMLQKMRDWRKNVVSSQVAGNEKRSRKKKAFAYKMSISRLRAFPAGKIFKILSSF